MRSLKQWQQQWQIALLADDEVTLSQGVVGNDQPALKRRVQVYTHGYRQRLQQMLRNYFPTLCAVLGKPTFNTLTNHYIEQHPSHFVSARHFIDPFVKFVRVHPDYQHQQGIIDIALWEWAQLRAVDAADAVPVTSQALQAMPTTSWPKMRFYFHPSQQVFEFSTNGVSLWQAVKKNQALPALQKISPIETWSVWRTGIKIQMQQHNRDDACLLQAALAQKNFAQLNELLCQYHTDDKVPEITLHYLLSWLQQGRIVDIEC